MTEKLLPCPKCNGAAVRIGWWWSDDDFSTERKFKACVGCSKCRKSVEATTFDGITAAWNLAEQEWNRRAEVRSDA